MKKIRAGLLAGALAVAIGAGTAAPAQAWWGYAEGSVSARSFQYIRCWDGRTVPAYQLRLGYGYPYDDGPNWVAVRSGDYWSHPVGTRWGGYPLSGFC